MENVQVSLKDLIFSNDTCENTIHGWIWYCDECQTHGNADSSDEADYMAGAHYSYMLSITEDMADNSEESEEDDDFDLEYETTPQCEGAIYIIDVDNAITYQHGDDYSNKTPNVAPENLDEAIRLRKMLGLTEQDDE